MAPTTPRRLPPRGARSPLLRRTLAACTCVLALAAGTAGAARERSAPAGAEIAEREADLKELRGRIESLRKELASAEESRSEAADQLRDSERSISQLQRELRELSAERDERQTQLRALGRETSALEAHLAEQQEQLEQLLLRQYRRGAPDALQLLLNGDDPNQIARDLYYLGIIARTRGALLRGIESNLKRKQALAERTREQAAELAALEARQKEQHTRLLAQRAEHRALLDRIASRMAAQKKEIGALQRDEKRMSALIERLTRIIAERAAAERAAAEKAAAERAAAARRAEAQRAKGGGEEKPSPRAETRNELLPQAVSGVQFARLRGSLRLPARGSVANRFGAPRQEGSSWKGLFIRSEAGAEVKAIAAGRVVFAEWMRGFGNLLIVDHGDAYLTIYGYNEALLKQVGDAVKGGDTVATVGKSGGHPETGLYFELRHQGQPLDPLKWVTLK